MCKEKSKVVKQKKVVDISHCFDVCKFKTNFYSKETKRNDTYEHLYDFIPTMEEAILLAQLAMADKRDDELVFILPGSNLSIDRSEEFKKEYEKALELAKKYNVQNSCD